ncbi:MAG TPA: DUF222 domain-containing protein [Acidimicrobiia bacterium]|nr:DUF222 domain-containing protein [Acidimicrobiia bacterium]
MPGVVEATAMPLERLEAEITQLAAHLDAARCRWLLLVAEFDRRAGYETWGCRSCAQWLSWHCGVDERAARERVRVARALEELPAVRDAFASGRLSYSKVRALTRIATAGNEDELVDLALHATAVQVERIVRAYRGVRDEQDETAEANRRHAEPHVRLDANDDGTVSIHGRLPAETAAVVRAALEAVRTRGPAGPAATTNADALVEICETYLAVGPHARTGGERTQVVVHVGEDRECTLDDDTWIAPETARRLACDASVVEVRPGGTASKRTRTVPAATRRAVHARDRGCRFPGCHGRVFLDVHHIRHWAHGGTHDLANLVELCWHHHRLVHEGGWSLRREPGGADGTFVAIDPLGRVVRPGQPARTGDQHAIEDDNRRRGIAIDSTTPIARWYGDPLDLDHVVTALWCIDHRGPAGPPDDEEDADAA